MNGIREKLSNMFSKVMAGTVTREEGTILLNSLAREDKAGTVRELSALIDRPPSGVFPKTILHTISLARNKAFYNMIVACLDHKDEGVAILAAHELAMQRTSDAREVLTEHLASDMYHVRKASATALVEGFGREGVEILGREFARHPEPFYRTTYAEAMARAGRPGVEALVDTLRAGGGAAVTAAETLLATGAELAGEDAPKVIEALTSAGDRRETRLTALLLGLVASLGERARAYEGFVRVFLDHPSDDVRRSARDALARTSPGAV